MSDSVAVIYPELAEEGARLVEAMVAAGALAGNQVGVKVAHLVAEAKAAFLRAEQRQSAGESPGASGRVSA